MNPAQVDRAEIVQFSAQFLNARDEAMKTFAQKVQFIAAAVKAVLDPAKTSG